MNKRGLRALLLLLALGDSPAADGPPRSSADALRGRGGAPPRALIPAGAGSDRGAGPCPGTLPWGSGCPSPGPWGLLRRVTSPSSLSPSHFLAPRGVSASPCMSSAAPWNPPLLQGVLDDIKLATRTRFGSHRHRPAWPHHEDLASLRPRVAIRTPCSDVVTPSWRQESRLSRKARRRPPRSHTREGKAETEISPAVTPPPSTWPEPKQNIGNPCH